MIFAKINSKILSHGLRQQVVLTLQQLQELICRAKLQLISLLESIFLHCNRRNCSSCENKRIKELNSTECETYNA